MKKYLMILCVFIICGCNTIKEETVTNPIKTTTPTPIEDPYVDENPITIALYDKINGVRKRIDEQSYSWQIGQDIVVLSAFAVNENEISGNNIKTVWTQYWEEYQDSENYRIGYHIKFSTKDGKEINKTILKPEDSNDFFDYLQIYLYDDIHQSGGWYSHVETMEENTILTSIKLTPSTLIDQIDSSIEVTVFTYKDENDFKDGTYRGNSKFTSIIQRKNT